MSEEPSRPDEGEHARAGLVAISLRRRRAWEGVAAGVVVIGIAVVAFALTLSFPGGRDGEPGPAVWPRVVLVIAAACAVRMVLTDTRTLRSTKGEPTEAGEARPSDSEASGDGTPGDSPRKGLAKWLQLIAMCATVLYGISLTTIGFALGTFAYLMIMLLVLRGRFWVVFLAISIGFPVAYYLLASLMQLDLPEGVLTPWLG